MGRRSLSDIQGNIDVSFWLNMPEALPEVFEVTEFFDRQAPLELEIGSGKGMFIRKAAAQFPERNFVGIELSYRYALASAVGLAKRDLRNAVMLNADAAQVLRDLTVDNSLDAVHVYFPDPWWKKAHRKRRILREDVVQWIERRLRPGGILHFWTDVEEYYLSTLTLLAAKTTLEGPFLVPEPEALDDMDYRTHFERRTRLHDLPVYRSWFTKPDPK